MSNGPSTRGRPTVKRTVRFNMLLSEEESQQLGEIAATEGLSASDWLRQLIRHTHATWKGTKT